MTAEPLQLDCWDDGWIPPRSLLGGIFGPPPPAAPPPPPQGISWTGKVFKRAGLSLPPSFGFIERTSFDRTIGLSLPPSFSFTVSAIARNRSVVLSVPPRFRVLPPGVVFAGLTLPPSFRLVGDVIIQDAGEVGLTLPPSFTIEGESFVRGFPYVFPFELA
jgi:hypothetical protein